MAQLMAIRFDKKLSRFARISFLRRSRTILPSSAFRPLGTNPPCSRPAAIAKSKPVLSAPLAVPWAAIDNPSRAAETTVDGHGVHSAVLGLTSADPALFVFWDRYVKIVAGSVQCADQCVKQRARDRFA
jgi:hypothetical protein